MTKSTNVMSRENYAAALLILQKIIESEGENRNNLSYKFDLLMLMGEPGTALDAALRIEEIADRQSPL